MRMLLASAERLDQARRVVLAEQLEPAWSGPIGNLQRE